MLALWLRLDSRLALRDRLGTPARLPKTPARPGRAPGGKNTPAPATASEPSFAKPTSVHEDRGEKIGEKKG